MALTVARKLILNAVGITVVLVGITLSSFTSINKLDSLQNDAVAMGKDQVSATQAHGEGGDLYAIIADAEINHELAQTEKDWAAETSHASHRLEELDKAATDPDEIAAMKKVHEGYNEFIRIFEKEMMPKLRTTTELTQEIRDLDGKIDKARETYSEGVEEMSKIQDAQIKEIQEQFIQASTNARSLNMIFSAVGILIALGMSFWLIRGISRPVNGMTKAMENLASGDTSVEIPGTNRKDEIGLMGKAVLVFKDNMIRNDQMAKEQEQLKKQAEIDKKMAMEVLAHDFEQSVGQIVTLVASAASELQASAKSLSNMSEQTSQQSAAVAASTEEASASVQTVAAAAEELSASIDEITRQIEESSHVTMEAVTSVNNTNTTVSTLSEAAAQIGDVVKLIQDIAEQTNLLALNATIEAARAGEAGKGFAVVASEVKNLATQTGLATEEISKKIATVQNVSTEAATAIRNIGSTIEHISEITTSISTAIHQQTAATREISNNVQQASAGTSEVSSSILTVTQAAAESRGAAGQVLQASSELSQQAERLRGEIQSFLQKVRQG